MALPTTKERLGSTQRVMRFFALVMALVYLGLGIGFLYMASQPAATGTILPLGPTGRLILGVVFVLYGLYRTVAALRSLYAKTPPHDFN